MTGGAVRSAGHAVDATSAATSDISSSLREEAFEI